MKSKWFYTYLTLALQENLSHPLGRAAYMVNRHYNGGIGRYFLSSLHYHQDETEVLMPRRIAALRTIKDDTAKRWERHFRNGGSFKAIKYTQAQWAQARAKRAAEIQETFSLQNR
jgi:hypothetical protein